MSSKIGREPWSIATRLTAWHAGAVMLLLASAVAAIHLSVKAGSEANLVDTIDVSAARIHANRDLYLRIADVDKRDSALRVVSPDGRTVFESTVSVNDFPADAFPPPGGRTDASTADRQPFTLFTREIDGWTYQIALNRSDERQFLILIYRKVALIALPTLLASLLAGYLLARAGLRPLRRVAAQMRAVSADRLDRRVPSGDVPRELAHVAASFNQVVERLATAVGRLDQFSADVAHELRTPVHNLRTAAELALRADRPADEYRQVLGSIVDEADELARLIDRLLLLARLSDPRAGLVREQAELATELADIRDFFEPAAAEAGVAVEVVAPVGLAHSVDRSLFQRAVSNLVANALAHTPAGGRVELRADDGSGVLVVEVRDTGRGIPADALPRLFDRYYRPIDTAGDGLGLGLAIVKRVTELHGGEATVTSEMGQGTTVRLTFPPESAEHDTDVTSVPRG